jgi:predicted CoA-substrate-specific enzyme activase
MSYYLGIDIGSVNVKLALVDDNGIIVHLDHSKINSKPRAVVASLINRLRGNIDLDDIVSAGVCGSGKTIIPDDLGWGEYSSPLSVASGLLNFNPDARTIIQIGGQSSLIIELEDGLKKPWKVASNPLCAAGTGRFLEQQAYRLGISMDDFANFALRCQGNPPRIAARCSVFAKSDLIHLQQKGTPVEAMLYALCESIARMVVSLKKGAIPGPVYFVGGVAANAAMTKALGEIISVRNGHRVEIDVPANYLHVDAIGSALLSIGKTSKSIMLPETDIRQNYFELPGLQSVPTQNSNSKLIIEKPCTGYLGVDVGSTSTKAVIINRSGEVLAKHYLMTAGRPVDAVKEVFKNLLECGAGKVTIAGVGVTGSGRYLVGSLIGADLVKNEITAQTRAAAEIDPDADIIEIGGQDSKLVIKRNGVVIDYQMNKACAAGTGSFIDELADMIGVSVKNDDFAKLAFNAPYTIDLGTRCAAFMGQAVASAQQEGIPLEIITASLSNSIAKNYLSKVVGHRKLGRKIILTGAVFHNRAVVAAFHEQLKGKNLLVPEHKETSGAIGAALLAMESVSGRGSHFKGFAEVVDRQCTLSTFTCKSCDNNCTISRMTVPGEKPTFYGSRCDRYDSTFGHAKMETSFDEREKLLLQELKQGPGEKPKVGIPRALLFYDYAPLLIGFLNALGVNVELSGRTNSSIIEQAVELSYSDSCFPIKLLHGHAASLKACDYILFPCAIRLGQKDGDENQRYACPLVQASPFIIRQVLGLGEQLLIPIIDFSQGTAEVISNLAETATKMGFNRIQARKAALAGIKAQNKFEAERAESGIKLLRQIHENGQIGVVLFTRSYMAQDPGANLGIAEKLAQLGVVPIPLDYLPLSEVDPKKYSDRPYWQYESKLIAASVLTESDPQLYGLVLTNFGCGPNSFILRLVEDIMGGKPLGQLEIDEHAAEAGIVTRLEAFVDTIRGFSTSGRRHEVPAASIYRGSSPSLSIGKILLIPRMAPQAEVVAAAMQASGVKAVVLPESDERSLLYGNQLTTGTECLPYRVCLGDFIRFYRDNGHSKDYEAFMAGSFGPCRLGKYSVEQMRVLREMGIDLPIRTSVSNNAYRDLNIGPGFERLAWSGIVFIDYLQKLLWRSRPYEKQAGSADRLFEEYKSKAVSEIRINKTSNGLMRQAASAFSEIINRDIPRKPLVGINGEIFLRANRFSNNDLVNECEDAGLEVVVSPLGEWFKYTSFRNLEDSIKDRKIKKSLISYIKKLVQEHDEHKVASQCDEIINEKELSTAELLALSGKYLSSRCGSEAVLSIGSGIDWMENPGFAGVVSVMPHGCMPGGIVAAMSDKFTAMYHKPWINLTYDGFMETNNLAKINNFAEILRYSSNK